MEGQHQRGSEIKNSLISIGGGGIKSPVIRRSMSIDQGGGGRYGKGGGATGGGVAGAVGGLSYNPHGGGGARKMSLGLSYGPIMASNEASVQDSLGRLEKKTVG